MQIKFTPTCCKPYSIHKYSVLYISYRSTRAESSSDAYAFFPYAELSTATKRKVSDAKYFTNLVLIY